MRMVLRDRSGVTSVEFALVAIPFFTLIFGTFDLGRSLDTLASAAARQISIQLVQNVLTSGGPGAACAAPYSPTQMQAIVPFLSIGGAPVLNATAGASTCTVTASKTFTPVLPVWGTAFNNPSATAQLPF